MVHIGNEDFCSVTMILNECFERKGNFFSTATLLEKQKERQLIKELAFEIRSSKHFLKVSVFELFLP